MTRRLLIITVLIVTLMPLKISASDDGGTQSVFNIGAGARAMGMGNGYTALAEDATAVYYNPAAMPYLLTQEVSFLHTVLFESTVYDYVSYVYPLSGIGSFGIAGMRIGTDDIGRRDDVTDLGRFSAARMQLLLSYGRRIGERFSAGGNLKLVHQAIDNYSAYGYGLDLAGRVDITEKLRAGILLQDIIGAQMKLVTIRERTPFSFQAGLAYEIDLKDRPFSTTVAFDLEKSENRSIKVHPGIEVAHTSGLAMRGGYDRDNFTLGMGLHYRQLDFDYAYKFVDNLSNSHRLSVSFGFGATKDEHRIRQDEQTQVDQTQLIEEAWEVSLSRELKKGDDFFNAGQLDSALAAYYRADAFVDDDFREDIAARISQIHQMQKEEMLDEAGPGAYANPDNIIRQANELMEDGDLKAARDLVDAAISNKVETVEILIKKQEIALRIDEIIEDIIDSAGQAFEQGQYIDAFSQYDRVLALDDTNLQASDGARAAKIQIEIAQHQRLALSYFNQKRYDSSRREFRSVLQLEPGNETARRYLRQIDKLRDPGTQVEKDLTHDQEMWQVYLDGLEAYRTGDFKKAIELWDKVLKKYPNDKMTQDNKKQAELRVNQ